MSAAENSAESDSSSKLESVIQVRLAGPAPAHLIISLNGAGVGQIIAAHLGRACACFCLGAVLCIYCAAVVVLCLSWHRWVCGTFQTHYCDHSVSVMCWDFLCLQPYFIVSQLCVADLSLNVTN